MRLPSVKTLKLLRSLKCDEDARRIRECMRKLHPRQAMAAIDSILGTYGVEYIPHGHNAASPAITYCNTGETYDATVLYVDGTYRVGSWGDIVERGNYD